MTLDRSLSARAHEIIHIRATSGTPVTADEAIREALHERCGGDYTKLLEMAAGFAGGFAREAKKTTYQLPEQASLFDLPAVIAVSTPLGDLFIQSDDATAGQVDQWSRDAMQFHGSQHKRFKTFRANFKSLDLDPSDNYKSMLKSIRAEAEQ